MKVCIYLRKSRADRDHPELPLEEVLKNHEAILLAFAEKNSFEITDIKKEVVSGESLARRPEMLKLLEEVEDGIYDAVLVKDFDRLGRGSMMEQGIIIEAFRKSATKIITPEKTYDLENEFDEEYIDISAFFARKELKMITKRLHSGRMKSISDGNYISPYAPYGYDKKQKSLEVNEKESAVVRLIFDLYVNQGYGDAKIAKYLTEHGVPNKHGSASWDKTTIRNMIRNPVYIGKVTWNKREYRYGKNGKRTSRFLNQSQWKVYEGRHDAIIEEALFERARQTAENNYVCAPRLHKAGALRNPAANLIKCGACGAAMTIRTAAGKSDTIRCCKHCGGNSGSYLHSVEERLIGLLEQQLAEFEIPFTFISVKKKSDAEYPVLIRSMESCEARKRQLNLQLSNLHDLLEQGVYDSVTFLERSKAVTENLRLTENKLEAVRKQLAQAGPQNKMNGVPRFKDLREFLRDVYWRLDPENKNEFLRDMIGSVVYSKPRGAEKDGFRLDIRLKD